jgi:hypothetical protein
VVDSDSFPRPGDKVLVPWGLEELVGLVVDVYSTGLGDQAVVNLADTGDPPSTVTVPADSLRRAGGISPGMSPRIDAMAYEHGVIAAIRRIAARLSLQVATSGGWDSGVDAVLLPQSNSQRVAVQVKFFGSGRVSSDVVAVLVGYAGSVGPMILIANGDLTSAASEHLRHSRRRKLPAWFVRWNGPDDDADLDCRPTPDRCHAPATRGRVGSWVAAAQRGAPRRALEGSRPTPDNRKAGMSHLQPG